MRESSPRSRADIAAQDLAFSSLSDRNGNYTLFNVAPGDYTITAFKSGYTANSVYVADVVALEGVSDARSLINRE